MKNFCNFFLEKILEFHFSLAVFGYLTGLECEMSKHCLHVRLLYYSVIDRKINYQAKI